MPSKSSPSFDLMLTQAKDLKEGLSSVIFGQESLVTETLCAFLAQGHVLITGAPGLAKTTLVRIFSSMLGLEFGRIQFTPDLLPSDITGSEILNIDYKTQKRSFEFCRGPVFVNLLLGDEINRASPRTQSAMLEAMQERNVTISGKFHKLPSPFMVFATQNPYEYEGTFPLPEAQLDRFMLNTLVTYPDLDSEAKILKEHVANRLIGENMHELKNVKLDIKNIIQMMDYAKTITVPEPLVGAIVELVNSTRPHTATCPQEYREEILYGAGPRAGMSLISSARSLALLEGKKEVRWQHIERMSHPVLRHRVKFKSSLGGSLDNQEDKFIDDLIKQLKQKYTHLAEGV
jgi:MoxR-like ATPase